MAISFSFFTYFINNLLNKDRLRINYCPLFENIYLWQENIQIDIINLIMKIK